MRRRPVRASVIAAVVGALALAPTVAGCTPDEPEIPEVSVVGEPGAAPTLDFALPLVVEEPVVEVLAEGTGDEVVDGRPVLLDYYAESGADASLVGETYSSEPKPYLLSAEVLGSDIHDALVGQRVGSRILHLVPGHDGGPSTVAVFDLLPTRAGGEPVTPREGLPTVTLADDGEPSIAVPATPAPTEAVVQPLVRGAGPQVEPGQVITVQYTGVAWSTGDVFDTTWGQDRLPTSFPIGVGSVLAGWDSGLVEQTVGSQVLLVMPPELAYGGTEHELANETLVFVVDILAASGGPRGG